MNENQIVLVDDMPQGDEIEAAKREAKKAADVELAKRTGRGPLTVSHIQRAFARRDGREWKRMGFADRQKYHRLAMAAMDVLKVSEA